MLNVFNCWLNKDLFNSGLSLPSTSLALQANAGRGRADQMRVVALTRMFLRFGYTKASPSPADTRVGEGRG